MAIVEPIRNIKNLENIKNRLYKLSKRDFCIFITGINTNLRRSDLVAITIGQAREILEGAKHINIIEKKTKKPRKVFINDGVKQSFIELLPQLEALEDTATLFRNYVNKPLSTTSITKLVKTWCAEEGLKGNYGAHTLRKTFGFHHYKKGAHIATLMQSYNHSNQAQTLHYLCIDQVEVDLMCNIEI